MHPLTTKIAAIERRLIVRQRLESVCRILAIVVGAMLTFGFLDYAVRYSDRGLRVIAFVAFVAIAGGTIYRQWTSLKIRQPRALSVARRIEQQFPQLGDSLASAVEFLQQSEEDARAGSAQLRRMVVAEAETAVESLPLETVIDARPLRRATIWATAAFGVVLVCLAFDASSVGTALARLISPLGDTQWPRQHYLQFRDPPARLAVGQTFEATLTDRSGSLPDDVRIEYRLSENGKRSTISEGMSRDGDVLVARRENVRHSFSFRATGGDDQAMHWMQVEVVEPPRAESLILTVHPPAYTGQPPFTAERHLDVLAGSRIEVTGTANEALAQARVLADGREPIAAEIGATSNSPASGDRTFHIAPDKWIATKAGAYELELANSSGITGVAASWRLRVEPDATPTVAWARPADDIHVLPLAVIPLQILVKDDLAIRSVELIYERSGRRGDEGGSELKTGRIELLAGPESPTSAADEVRTVDHVWSLASLGLKAGDQLTLRAEASDYRPGVGKTLGPRRVTIITIEELDARLAEQQTQIVRQLERALTAQRATRDEARRVAIQQRDAGALAAGDRNALQSAELNQRRVGWMLGDAKEGIPALVESLLAELEMNGVASPDVARTMRGLKASLGELAGGSLSTAERELTAARKESNAASDEQGESLDPPELPPPQVDDVPGVQPLAASPQTQELQQSLSAAGAAQDEVIATVERLVADLSGSADFSRHVRELSQLHIDQIAHERTTRAEIGIGTMPLELNELTRDQRANLNKASAGEDSIARRFENILLGMRQMAESLDLQDAKSSDTLKDAIALAERQQISSHMQDATRALAANRVNRALDLERQVAAELEQMLKFLRHQGPTGADRLDEMRQAQEKLQSLRAQLTALREQAARAASQGPTAAAEREQLGQRQDELRREIERLSRELERLKAGGAGASANQSASALNNRPPGEDPSAAAPPKPGTDEELKQAEQKLDAAATELAEARAQAELDLALEFINRFRGELEEMIASQQKLIVDTEELDGALRANRIAADLAANQLTQLEARERELLQTAVEQRELLMGLAAVRISLQDAERRLASAVDLLAAKNSGIVTQQAERHALARLEAMLEAFAQTAAEAQKKPEGGNRRGGGNQGQPPPQRRPAFELLEVKMLRILQIELNQRTAAHQIRLAADGQANAQRADLVRESLELAAEQQRLAELAREMLSRNNRQQQGE